MVDSDPGDFDRMITIQRAAETTNAWNEDVKSNWLPHAVVWANRRDASAGESYRAQEVGAQITARFRIWYSPDVADVNPKDRIVEDERVYAITAVREIERKALLEIDGVARADT